MIPTILQAFITNILQVFIFTVLQATTFYNLGIHVESSNQGTFNVWTENVASSGTLKVGPCLPIIIIQNVVLMLST